MVYQDSPIAVLNGTAKSLQSRRFFNLVYSKDGFLYFMGK